MSSAGRRVLRCRRKGVEKTSGKQSQPSAEVYKISISLLPSTIFWVWPCLSKPSYLANMTLKQDKTFLKIDIFCALL